MAAALGTAHWQASAVHTLAEKISFIFYQIKFRAPQYVDVCVVGGAVGGKLGVATKNEIKDSTVESNRHARHNVPQTSDVMLMTGKP